MNCIILGDKYKKGMKSRGCSGLIKIDKHTIFDLQYAAIKKYFPNSSIVYVGGFEAKKIEHHINKHYNDVVFINNQYYESYNEAYSLYLAKNFLSSNILIISGYSLIHKKFLDKFDISLGSQVFINAKSNTGIGCTIQNNTIRNISFDLPNEIDDAYYMTSDNAKILNQILSTGKYRNYFIFELLNYLIDHNTTIKPFYYRQLNSKVKNYEHS